MNWDVLAIAFLVAASVTGLLAWRGKLSWAWAISTLAAALAVLSRRRKPAATFHPPPKPRPATEAVAPVLAVVDDMAAAEREDIRDAESEEDRWLRLKRLSETGDGGAQ